MKKGFKIFLRILLVILIIILAVIAGGYSYFETKISKLQTENINKNDVGISDLTLQDLKGYRNIALQVWTKKQVKQI